jgi:hypothetical protein
VAEGGIQTVQQAASAPEIADQLYLSVNTVKTTCATCTTSSACTAATRPSNKPAFRLCWPLLREGPDRGRASRGRRVDHRVISSGHPVGVTGQITGSR